MKKLMLSLLMLSLAVTTLVFPGAQVEAPGVAAAEEVVLGPGPSRLGGRWATPADYAAATGRTLPAFKEAPMLAEMVAAGELPPVNERLPNEPLVTQPVETIGKYGGTLTIAGRHDRHWGFQTYIKESLLQRGWDDPAQTVLPNALRGWDLSDDARAITLYLREGMRWSNGDPFTAADFLFWYEDVVQNEEYTPVIPPRWTTGGELFKMRIIDDYTVRMEFAAPWPGVIYSLSFDERGGDQMTGPFMPSEYMKQFHIKYNTDAGELAKAEGYDYWYQLFKKKQLHGGHHEPGLPLLNPWIPETLTTSYVVTTRNPYYFKVDTAGNQLPYIDKMLGVFAGNFELLAAKVMDGESDAGIGPYAGAVDIGKLPVLMKVAEKNNYRVSATSSEPQWASALAVLFFNHTNPDPVLRELFSNVKFKQAMSHAINRQEISQLVYQGVVEPTMSIVQRSDPYYVEEYAKKYIEYDPEESKRLLDEIGLEVNAKGFRLRADTGEELEVVLRVYPRHSSHAAVAELVKDYWNEIGIRMTIDHAGAYEQNETMIELWQHESDYSQTIIEPKWWSRSHRWGRNWQQWFQFRGEQGEEPPAEVKEFNEVWSKIPYTVSEEERIRLGKRGQQLLSENLWYIPLVRPDPEVRFVRRTIGNVDLDRIPWLFSATNGVNTWYFKE